MENPCAVGEKPLLKERRYSFAQKSHPVTGFSFRFLRLIYFHEVLRNNSHARGKKKKGLA